MAGFQWSMEPDRCWRGLLHVTAGNGGPGRARTQGDGSPLHTTGRSLELALARRELPFAALFGSRRVSPSRRALALRSKTEWADADFRQLIGPQPPRLSCRRNENPLSKFITVLTPRSPVPCGACGKGDAGALAQNARGGQTWLLAVACPSPHCRYWGALSGLQMKYRHQLS